MKNLKNWIIKRLQGVGTVLMTLPAVVAFLLFAAIAAVMRIGTLGETDLIDNLFLTFVVGAVSNLLLMLLTRRKEGGSGWQLAITGIGIIVPCGVFLLLYGMEDPAGLWEARVVVMIAVMLLGILWLLCKRLSCGITTATWQLLRRLLVGVVFAGIFFVTCVITGFLTSMIIGMTMMADVIWQLLVFAGFICLLFVLRAFVEPTGLPQQSESVGYRQAMEKVVSYILIPLMLCFFVVELLLVVRAAIYNNWPETVDTFSRMAVLLGTGVLIYLLCSQFNNRSCRFFRVFFPCAGLLLLGVGAWQLIRLIIQYGMTENRYLVLVGILIFAIFLIFMLTDLADKGRLACLVMSAFMILSVLPFVNYHTVSAYSQMARAENIMERYGMLVDNRITPPAAMNENDRLELSRAVQYLYDQKETAMAKWLPIYFNFYEDYAEVFGVAGEFDTAGQSTLVAKTYLGLLADKYYPTDGYDIVLTNYTTYNLLNFTAQDIAGTKGVYTVRFSQVAGDSLVAVVIRDGQTVAEADVTDQLLATAQYLGKNASGENESVAMPLEQMTVQFESDDIRVRVVLKSISVTADRISRGLSTALTDIILIDEK